MIPDFARDNKIFTLDKWFLRLGLWREDALLNGMSETERADLLKMMDISSPYVISHSDNDAYGRQLASLSSYTHYDPITGRFEDQIVYWRHLPESNFNADKPEIEDQIVLTIRGQCPRSEDPNASLPVVLPEQIWVNGSNIFSSPYEGGNNSPFEADKRRLINWALDASQLIKQQLQDKRPFGDVLKAINLRAPLTSDFSAQASGTAITLRGLTPKGFDAEESILHAYFNALDAQQNRQVRFTLPPISGLSSVDRLKTAMGYSLNTREPMRALTKAAAVTGSTALGDSYKTQSVYRFDPETGQHIFTLSAHMDDPIYDAKTQDDLQIARLAFYENPHDHSFTLEDIEFAHHNAEALKTHTQRYDVINFMQKANVALSKGAYPPYGDLAYEYNLSEFISGFNAAPSVHSEKMFQTLWMPLFGTSFKERLAQLGAGIGGGNLFINRNTDENGQIDEISVLQGVPFEPGKANSEYAGLQPDLHSPDIRKALKRGLILIDHIHFDHSTIEYWATQRDENGEGYFRNQKIMLKEYDYEIVRKRLMSAGVPPRDWPEFIVYDKPGATDQFPDLHQDPDNPTNFVYIVRDENGHKRFAVQVCKNASAHSAPTDASLITSCYDDKIGDTYYIDNDAYGSTEHGRKFASEGQMALARILPDEFKREDLLAAVPSLDKLYISLEEATSTDVPGHVPTNEAESENWGKLMRSLPANMAANVASFSTNHAEMQLIMERCARTETQRNITAVGKNMEDRLAAMRKCGVNLEQEIAQVELTKDQLPVEFFDTALKALEGYLKTRIESAEHKAGKNKGRLAAKDLLQQDKSYQLVKYIISRTKAQNTRGDQRPNMLFDLFLNGDPDAYKALAVKRGLCAEIDMFEAPSVVVKAFEALKEQLAEQGHDPDSHCLSWMVSSFLRFNKAIKTENKEQDQNMSTHCGKVTFSGVDKVNEYLMYLAIEAGQDEAAQYATRGSKKVKEDWLQDLGKMLFFTTGPIGAIQDDQASLSRLSRGHSLFDSDPETRPTGLYVPMDKQIFIVPQTPSMGSEAKIAQDALLAKLAKNRDVTIMHAYKNGMRIINPKEHRAHFENVYRQQGCDLQDDPDTGGLYIPDFPIHRNGHRFYQDMVDKQTDPVFKAKGVEAIHIASRMTYERLKDAVREGGREITIDQPDDWIAREWQYDPKTRTGKMVNIKALNPQYVGIELSAPYGQAYGQVVRLLHMIFDRPEGGVGRQDGLNVRSDPNAAQHRNRPAQLDGAWNDVANGQPSMAQNKVGPSVADIQATGGKPQYPTRAALIPIADDFHPTGAE